MFAYEFVQDLDPCYKYKKSEDEVIVTYAGEEGDGEIVAAIDMQSRKLVSIVSFDVDTPFRGIGTKLFQKLREIYPFEYCTSAFWEVYSKSFDVYEAIKYTPAWKIRDKCGQINCVVSFDEISKELQIISRFS
jgi:hypothetical protein